MKHKSTASVPHATLQSTVRLGARGTQLDPDGLAPGDAPFTFYKNLLCVEHVVATAKGQARPHNHGRRVPVHGEHESHYGRLLDSRQIGDALLGRWCAQPGHLVLELVAALPHLLPRLLEFDFGGCSLHVEGSSSSSLKNRRDVAYIWGSPCWLPRKRPTYP